VGLRKVLSFLSDDLVNLSSLKTCNNNLSVREFRVYMTKKHMWGGYDKVISFKQLDNERVFNLLYSFLNCAFNDLSYCDNTFIGFCDEFGYDLDSIKSKKTYEAVISQGVKFERVLSGLACVDKSFLLDNVVSETELFLKELREVVLSE